MTYEREKAENRRRILEFEADSARLSGAWDGGVNFYPRYLQIEHTARCNARCIMCRHLYTANRGAGEIDERMLYALEGVLKYVETAMLNGDGEPFLYSGIHRSLALFREYGVKVGTNTNLTVVSDAIWEYIANDFAFLNISCDGSSRKLYEGIRRGLSFDAFTENLEKLNHVAPNLKKNMDCVLMRQNIADMEGLVRLAARYGFSSVRFHTLGVNPVIGNGEDSPSLYPHCLGLNAALAEKAAIDLGIAIQLPRIRVPGRGDVAGDLKRMTNAEAEAKSRIERLEASAGRFPEQSFRESVKAGDLSPAAFEYGDICRWAVERCYIDLSGNVTTCCYDVRHRYGNLKEESFDEIWNGPMYKRLRLEMLNGRLPAWCKTCQWLKNPLF